MKSLAYIGAFTLGAFAGGTLIFSAIVYGLENRTRNLVDDNAVVYEDENMRVTRCNINNPNDKAAIATIIYKNR